MKFLYIKIDSRIFIFILFCLIALWGIFFIKVYPELFQIYPELQKTKLFQVQPNDFLKIVFNYPISKNSFDFFEDFSIEPEIKGDIIFQDRFIPGFYKTIVFKPRIPFNLSSVYNITLKNLRSIYGTRLTNYTFSFITISPPKIKSTFPEDKSQGVPINSDLKVILSHPNKFFNFEFSLNPEAEFEVLTNQEKSVYILRPKQKLRQFTDYILNIATYYNFGSKSQNRGIYKKGLINTKKISFKTKKPLEIVEIIPKDGQDKVSTEQGIEITFSRKVNYKSVEKHLIISPQIKAEFIWQDRKLYLFPYQPFKEDTTYEIKLTSGILGYKDGSYLEKEIVSRFKTRPKFPEKVISKVEVTPQITEGKYIDIDLASQTLTIFEDGKSLGKYKVSTGKYSMPTPKGSFTILNKIKRAYSSSYNLWMPYWMAFTKMGHGIHELPEWPGGIKEGESHLGIPVSHGCVRLGVGPAERVYHWADIGTPVIVH